jgi:uncharacterized membrane protein
MAFYGTKGGNNRNSGRGGFHPGAIADTASSAAAGSLGTATVSGSGASTSTTTSNAISGQRQVFDPWHNGITYTVVSGALPPGFTLNASTGQIAGAYAASGINTDGTVYNFTIRASDNSPGAKTTSDRSYSVTLSVPWLYRQIITTMYMAGGYKDSTLWSNTNRFPRSTETCTNLGDGTIDNYHYKSGMCDDNRGHVWNGNSTTTFQMRTEVKVNGVGAPGFATANTGTTFAPDRNRSFTVGEGVNNCFRFTASTNAFATLGGGNDGNAAAISGENKGIWWGTGTNANRRIVFSTEAQATIGIAAGAHGQQKGMPAKTGFGYGGNEGTYAGGYNFRKTNITNETYGTVAKMWGNCGEENFGMSQDNGYMLGQYDDSIGQNNRCGRHVYATDVGSQLGTTVQGHAGASSGHGFWRD